MPPPRKDICDCRALENASKEPDHAIRWDESMHEYYIAYGKGAQMRVYYCQFCGGTTPKSRRASFFAHVTEKEETRIYNLFRGIRTVADVVARFGPPDEDMELGSGVRRPDRDGMPESGEIFRTLVYEKLSPVADIRFDVGNSDTVRGMWMQKYVGDPAA